MPLRLQTRAKDGDGMDIGAAAEDQGGRESSAKSCQFFRVEESIGNSSGGKE